MGIVFGKTGVAEPSFEKILTRSTASLPYEIRQYGVRYAIETEYNSAGGGQGGGFRALAGYIGVGTKPQNEGSVAVAMTAPVVTAESDNSKSAVGEKIAMTAPVVTSNKNKAEAIAMTAPVVTSASTGGDVNKQMKKMQFMLPEKYDDMSKIPKPTNPNVVVKEVPAATGAVHTFNGSMNDSKEKSTVIAFAKQLKDDGVDMSEEETLSKYDLWQFHPPFTLGPLKKNEIWVPLTTKQVDELLKKFKEDKES